MKKHGFSATGDFVKVNHKKNLMKSVPTPNSVVNGSEQLEDIPEEKDAKE